MKIWARILVAWFWIWGLLSGVVWEDICPLCEKQHPLGWRRRCPKTIANQQGGE